MQYLLIVSIEMMEHRRMLHTYRFHANGTLCIVQGLRSLVLRMLKQELLLRLLLYSRYHLHESGIL